jgi:glycosyltransferase involved in cell wall biosynthesis
MRPEITVIVPYHNEKDTIEFTLERVGEQTLAPKTAIFVNSSSTDGSPQIVDEWIGRNQQRFFTRFVNLFERTDNPASSKNAGIRRAETEWVAFMDCGQNFERNWLEQQFRFASDRGLDVVSGVVYLVGENWVDRCAVAQTYGYRRNRPCIPTTLARRAIFEAAGLFLEGRRAHYDAVWAARLKELGIERGVNEAVRIEYIGTNFAASLAQLYGKSVLYATPAVAIEGYWMPYAYAIGSLLFAVVIAVSIEAAAAIFLLYFLARACVIPILKSRGIAYFREHPVEALAGLGIVGTLLDVGKTVGTWKGMRQYYLAKYSASGR